MKFNRHLNIIKYIQMINIGMIYKSLRYVTYNFRIVVSLSIHVNEMLKKINYTSYHILYKVDQEIFNDLIVIEPDIDAFLHHMLVVTDFHTTMLSNVPLKIFVYTILANCAPYANYLKFLFAACCEARKEEYAKIMLNKFQFLSFDLNYSFEVACKNNCYKIAKFLLKQKTISLSFDNLIMLFHDACNNYNLRICKLLTDIIFEKHLDLDTELDDGY